METASATLRIRLAGGLARTVVGSGVVNAAGLADMCGQTLALLDGLRPAAYLADFRRPVWALRTSDLDAFFDGADAAVEAPAALVVADAYLPLFRAHAWNVAQGGILRKVFTDYESAERWCQMRVALHRQAQTAP